MKRAKKKPRRHGGHGAVQFFDCGPWRFNVTKALRLASNRAKYSPVIRRPTPDWIGPFIEVDASYAERSDSNAPVLFATVIQHGQPWRLLIDGNHRVVKALQQQTEVAVLALDLGDTLQVLSAPPAMIELMKRDGRSLGLLPDSPA
jgi:hypothetical protein